MALAIGVLIHILTFFIPNNQINRTSDGFTKYSFNEKNILALIPNLNLIWGIKMLISAEGKGTGIQWDTFFTRERPDDPHSMGAGQSKVNPRRSFFGLERCSALMMHLKFAGSLLFKRALNNET